MTDCVWCDHIKRGIPILPDLDDQLCQAHALLFGYQVVPMLSAAERLEETIAAIHKTANEIAIEQARLAALKNRLDEVKSGER